MNKTHPSRRGLLVLLALLVAAPAWAQKVTFRPTLGMGAFYSDNVGFDEVGDEVSDSASFAAVELPVVFENRATTFDSNYRGIYRTYQDVDALDGWEHILKAGVDSQLNPRSTLNFATGYSLTQEQTREQPLSGDDLEDTDLFLTNRTERQRVRARLRFHRQQSPRWGWTAGAGWADTHNSEVASGVGGGDSIEDRTEYRGSFEFARTLSSTSSLGVAVEHRRFDLERSGVEESNVLGATYTHAIADSLDLNLSLGAFRSKGEAADGPDGEDERTGVAGTADLIRTYRTVRLGFNLAHGPTSGGHLIGTSTDTRVGLKLSGRGNPVWDWSVSPRYSYRDPADDTDEPRKVASFNGTVARRVVGQLDVQLNASYRKQTERNAEDITVGTIAAGVVWHLRGREGRPRGK